MKEIQYKADGDLRWNLLLANQQAMHRALNRAGIVVLFDDEEE